MNKHAWILVLILIAALGKSARADSPVILTINISDPSAVVITATGLAAENNDSSTSTFDGADLLQFFTTDVAGEKGSVTGNLFPAGTVFTYFNWTADNAGGSSVNLNLYGTRAITMTQIFSTDTPAFTGSLTLDLSAVVADLPSVGAHNDIIAGWTSNQGQVIGSWLVVAPEPSPSSLLCLGLAALASLTLWRRTTDRTPQATKRQEALELFE